MNIHINEALRQQIKERRARLGYVQTRPVVPIHLVRPGSMLPKPMIEPEPVVEPEPVPELSPEQLNPQRELKFRPRLIKPKHPRVDDVLVAVAYEFGISQADIISPSRVKEVIIPRHIAVYIARQMTELSLPAIGRYMGGRDHTTALNSWRKARALMAKDEELRDRVGRIMVMIREGLGL